MQWASSPLRLPRRIASDYAPPTAACAEHTAVIAAPVRSVKDSGRTRVRSKLATPRHYSEDQGGGAVVDDRQSQVIGMVPAVFDAAARSPVARVNTAANDTAEIVVLAQHGTGYKACEQEEYS